MQVPDEFKGPIQEFEKAFTVGTSKLKQIVNHFVKELEKGRWLTSTAFTTTALIRHRFNRGGRKHRGSPMRSQLDNTN